MNRFLETVYSICFFLFFRLSSWLCSLPMWITLILHFTIGLSWWWFIATLIAWLLAGLIRYALIRFGRWGAAETRKQPPRKNRNPYSAKNEDIFHEK
ncbi:MAG: hypothetical protein IKE65_06860 [Clostridia bacterium]|nr:hypothetical protein [Clostridia bacterium]